MSGRALKVENPRKQIEKPTGEPSRQAIEYVARRMCAQTRYQIALALL